MWISGTIATTKGGSSNPEWLSGWILAFIGFNDDNRYYLPDLDEIKKTNCFGELNPNYVPNATVDVPVTIYDNGTGKHVSTSAASLPLWR